MRASRLDETASYTALITSMFRRDRGGSERWSVPCNALRERATERKGLVAMMGMNAMPEGDAGKLTKAKVGRKKLRYLLGVAVVLLVGGKSWLGSLSSRVSSTDFEDIVARWHRDKQGSLSLSHRVCDPPRPPSPGSTPAIPRPPECIAGKTPPPPDLFVGEKLEGDGGADELMMLARRSVVDWFCTMSISPGDVERCLPRLVSNSTIKDAGFYWRDNTIRYNWDFLDKVGRHKYLFLWLGDRDEAGKEKFIAFSLGVLAHEYAHYLDFRSKGKISAAVAELVDPSLLDPKTVAEAAGDYFAGCMAALMDSPDPTMEFYIQGSKANENYPDGDARVSVFGAGKDQCRVCGVPPSIREVARGIVYPPLEKAGH